MLDPDPDSMESKVLDILVFRTEGSSLDFLYGGLGIIKLQFVSSKKKHFFSCIFLNLWSSKPWIRILTQWNPDPQHWFY
jgi:hypothetical protein